MDEMKSNADSDVLVVEPFYCGSHKQLVDCLMKDAGIGSRAHLVTMTGKKWHWRSRVSALYLSTVIPVTHQFRVLFSSSVLNLAELTALRPDLAGLHKVLYFHENQLQYPVRKQKDRDFQYGYNQILSCLVADCILFNSSFNMESFLSSVNSFLKLMPDYRPKGLIDKIRPKCSVLYFPMVYKNITPVDDSCQLRGDTQLMHAFSSDEAHFPQYKAGCCSSKLEMCQDFTDIQSQQEDPADGTHLSGSCGSIGQSQMQFSHHALPDKFEKTLPLAAQSSLMESLACSSADDIVSSHGHGEDENVKNQEKCGGAHQEKVEDLDVPFLNCSEKKQACLHIVWPHRWEHDKDPETFFQVLFRLQTEGVPFVVSVLGETFADVPDIFEEAQKKLKDHIHAWGYQAEKSAYLCILKTADVVVSTSRHEFFGVAMLEAVHHGCYPLCPKALVYPEIYPEECLYSTSTQLYKRLRSFCRHPHLARRSNVNNYTNVQEEGRGRKSYASNQNMMAAYKAVMNKKMSAYQSAKHFGVDKKSLLWRVRNEVPIDAHAGRSTALPPSTEQELADCLLVLSGWGWGFGKEEVKDIIKENLTSYDFENPFTDNWPSRDWFSGFLHRHPNLVPRKTEHPSNSRARSH